ncbi:MAG: radical SAM family heme chaperone HemW, partial [Pirellulaceae bacterium]
AGRSELVPAFLDALEAELSCLGEPHAVETLYLGGGTPSYLPLQALQRVVDMARHWFPLQPGHEFTLEANPADLTAELALQLVSWGVTRVVLGVQSFQDAMLAELERDHREEEIRGAVGVLQDSGIHLSLDMMFAVPGQTLAGWQRDLQDAVELAAEHISVLGLVIEQGTPFHARAEKGELVETGEELQRSMYLAALDQLQGAGFEHYEISSFSKPGHRSRHNQVYWNGEDYYAAGPGATRLINGRRETNHRETTTYLKKIDAGLSPVCESSLLSAEMAARERLVFGLCQIQGIEAGEFLEQTGYPLRELMGEYLEQYTSQGLLDWDESMLRLTRDGLLVSDSLWPPLLHS